MPSRWATIAIVLVLVTAVYNWVGALSRAPSSNNGNDGSTKTRVPFLSSLTSSFAPTPKRDALERVNWLKVPDPVWSLEDPQFLAQDVPHLNARTFMRPFPPRHLKELRREQSKQKLVITGWTPGDAAFEEAIGWLRSGSSGDGGGDSSSSETTVDSAKTTTVTTTEDERTYKAWADKWPAAPWRVSPSFRSLTSEYGSQLTAVPQGLAENCKVEAVKGPFEWRGVPVEQTHKQHSSSTPSSSSTSLVGGGNDGSLRGGNGSGGNGGGGGGNNGVLLILANEHESESNLYHDLAGNQEVG
jgi:hypothetical protein